MEKGLDRLIKSYTPPEKIIKEMNALDYSERMIRENDRFQYYSEWLNQLNEFLKKLK